MNLDFLSIEKLRYLNGEEFTYIVSFCILASIFSSFLITLYTLKDKTLICFVRATFLSYQFLVSLVVCLLTFLFCVWLYGYGQYAWFIFIVLMVLFVLSCIDCVLLAIPDWLNFALFFFVFAGLHYFDLLVLEHFVSAFSICGAFSLLRVLGQFVFRKEIMGEADIVVVASMGAIVMLIPSLYLVLISSFLAMGYIVLISLIHLRGKKIALSQIKVPFVLFLFLGFVITLFYLRYPLWGELGV